MIKPTSLFTATLFGLAGAMAFAVDVPTPSPSVPPPASLILDSVPPIPADVAEEARRFTEFRAASLASWHPTKREMLVRTRFADTLQVHHVRQPLGMRKQMTFFPDSVGSAQFPPTPSAASGSSAAADPGYFLFTKDIGGSEFNQIFRQDLSTGEVEMLTDGKSRNSSPIFTEDGKRFVYTSTRRNRKDPDFYVADSAKPSEAKLVYQADA